MPRPFQIDPVSLARALVRCQSVTPNEGGALTLLEKTLAQEGFKTWRKVFSQADTPDVDNLFATIGSGSPHIVFGGHTDVVPAGDEAAWSHPPFGADEVDGVIYGRGIEDMKGGVAAFCAAAVEFIKQNGVPETGSISLLITGDEEGPAINGTKKLLEWASDQGFKFDAALVGEPTNVETLGDVIKVGRRGSLSGTITINGKQGHVAYQERARNPSQLLPQLVTSFALEPLDDGFEAFLPSNLEFVSIDTNNDAWNVIPQTIKARFNIRYNANWTRASLEAELIRRLKTLDHHGYGLEISFKPDGSECFLTQNKAFVDLLSGVVENSTGIKPALTTGGGTSDARYFKDYCPVAEFGLVGRSMHQIDEHSPVCEIEALTEIYYGILEKWF